MVETSLVVTLLSTVLTGGILMLFIESHKLSSSVIDRFQDLMKPFYYKLSNYMKFVSLFRGAITIDVVKGDERLKTLNNSLDNFSRLCVSSTIPVGYFSGSKLEDICLQINNVWYCIDHKRGVTKDYISFDDTSVDLFKGPLTKYIVEVDSKYEKETFDLDFFARVSGDFYGTYFEPIKRTTYEYEYWQKKEKQYRVLSLCALCVTLISMLLIIFIPNLCDWTTIVLTLTSSIMLICELFALIKLDRLANDVCRP